MRKKLGARNRITRLLMAVLIVTLYFFHDLTGYAALGSLLFAFLLTITGISGTCLFYLPVGIYTNQKSTDDSRN